MLAVPVIIVLAAVISFSGILLAQDIEKAKADYERLVAELLEIDKQMQALTAGQQGQYEKLKAQYDEIVAEIERLKKILQGDQETQRKIGEVVKLYNDGAINVRIGRYIDALDKFNEAISKGEALNNPLTNNAIKRSYFGIATVYSSSSQKKYAEMIEPLENAISVDPNYFQAYNLMAKSYEGQGKLDSAIESYTKSIEINDTPENYLAHHNMGVVYFKMTEHAKAKEKFLHAIELNPQYYKSFNYLGRSYFELKEYGNARQALEMSIKLNTAFWEHYYYIAQVYNKTKQYKEAVEAANTCMKYHTRKTNFGGALIERGIAYEFLDRNDLALEDYQTAAKDRQYKQTAEYHIELLTKHGGMKALIDTPAVYIHNRTLIDANIFLKRYNK